MTYDKNCKLWPNNTDVFFRDKTIQPIQQVGPHCVATCMAMITTSHPDNFHGKINTQDPVSWSIALSEYGMKLAYCPTDARKLKFYMDELLELDDLFTLSYYTPLNPQLILRDPDELGWICGSHIVVLHGNNILDPATGNTTSFEKHACIECHTKRIFRLVHTYSNRGI